MDDGDELSAEHLEFRLIQSKQDIETATINLYVCIYILFIYSLLYFYLLPISLNITSTVFIMYIPVMYICDQACNNQLCECYSH